MKTKLFLVANNHIDREWTYDAQLTRILTVKFFEDLLEAFRKIPDFQFVLDSQAVPLDDFLEIFPDRRDILTKHIAARRLWAGPWYTAPDCFYLAGESIVRNLLVGHRVAGSFGNVSKFGYTPFGWGQVSQLPQIYSGFGIDSAFFYRGADTIDDVYYNWKGADGTTVRCIKYHRTNFFDKVFRPVTKAREPVPWDRELTYCGDEVPFMFGDDGHKYEHGFVADGRYHIRQGAIAGAVEGFLKDEAGAFPGGLVLGMNGMDTCFPSLKGLLAVDKYKRGNPPGCSIVYSNLDAFSRELKRAARDLRLNTHEGEMRRFLPGFGGKGKSEVKSTHFYLASARPRQKSRNALAENLLTRNAEPAAAVADLLGLRYPVEFLDSAWKHLLKCHPHDTIAGCGVDQIEVDMLNRLDQAINISKGVLTMSLKHIVTQIDNRGVGDGEIALVMFNPCPSPRKESVPVWLHLPGQLGIGEFEVVEKSTGKNVEFSILGRGEMADRIFRDLTDTTLYVHGELVRIRLDVEIGGLGYKTYLVRKARSSRRAKSRPLAGKNRMENEFLRVRINADGSLDVHDKASARTFRGLHHFTDTGDNGDPWVRFVPDRNRRYATRGTKAGIRLLHNDHLEAKFEISHNFMIPEGLNKRNYNMEGYYDDAESSENLVPMRIRSIVTMTRGSALLDIETEIENPSTDHLVQVVFPTGLKTQRVFAESAFDVVERRIKPNKKNEDPSLVNGEDPFLRFVDISDGKAGLCLISDSVKGYEALGDAENSIALNLIRSYTSQIVTIYGRKEQRAEQGLTQVPGLSKFHYAIHPHTGSWEDGCGALADGFNCPVVPVQTHRSFGSLPSDLDILKFSTPRLAMSSLKKAEDGRGLILRVFNPSPKPVKASVEFFLPLRRVAPVNLNEEPLAEAAVPRISGKQFHLVLGPKKIASYRLIPQSAN